MAIGFIMWSMASFDKQNFAICGRTIEALRRNVIVHIPTWLEGMFEVTERRSENKMVVTIGNRSNTYYLFGATPLFRALLWQESSLTRSRLCPAPS